MERDVVSKRLTRLKTISTHTLTWSVTGCVVDKHTIIKNFNSHAHVERDDNNETKITKINNFNSHAHVERDVQKKTTAQHPQISTHTLTWSVTGVIPADILYWQFQLTRSRGA